MTNSLTQFERKRAPVTRLTPDEAIAKINTIADEANQKIKAAYEKVEYWMRIAEELGEVLKEKTEENNQLRAEVALLKALREENFELKEKLSRLKQKSRELELEEIEMRKRKRK